MGYGPGCAPAWRDLWRVRVGGEEGDGLRSVVSGALWRGMAKHMWTPTIASYRVAVIM
jgi:hypothetical protein